MDPALGEHTGERQIAFWKPAASNPDDHFSFRVALSEAASFNLSLYAHAADLAPLRGVFAGEPTPFAPLRHHEQYGRALKFRVTDLDGTREFPLFSDAAGVWLTFPVRGDETQDVVVQVEAFAPYNTHARLSAVAFDPHQSRRTSFLHDPAGRSGRIERPDGSTFRIEHDRFGNVSRVVDALGRSVRFRYDGLDRLVEALTALGHAYKLTYDPVGHLATFVEPGSPGPATGYP